MGVKQLKYGNIARQINIVQDKQGNRTEYFDSDCGLVQEAK
ncbi:hypothetical protein [Latilactobacillus phage TMW 1.1365 P3]|nr:hypothetical protein [Latilactobacillus phage TMW 1.1365 P3]